MAGRARSSGLAWLSGWPGGATGLRIASKTGRSVPFRLRFGRIFFTAMRFSFVALA
jgi:hypothetical protein